MGELHEFTIDAVPADPRSLSPGDVLVHRKGGRLTTLAQRKAEYEGTPLSGWWCARFDAADLHRLGLADFVIERDWLLVVEVRRDG